MLRTIMTLALALALGSAAAASEQAVPSSSSPLDIAQLDRITGLVGSPDANGMAFKVSKPRSDVAVVVRGRRLDPSFGLTSWAVFSPGKAAPAMLVGDLILLEDELMPVMDAALGAGLSITALHHHLVNAQPNVYSMHIGGEGSPEVLAKGVRAAFETVTAIRQSQSRPVPHREGAEQRLAGSLAPDRIGAILGVECAVENGVVRAVLDRTVRLPCGCVVGKEMGGGTTLAFAGSDESAILDGTIVTFAGELQPVLASLRKADIDVVGIHSQFEGESPAAIAVHCWGEGNAADLASGVRSALVAQANQAPAAGAQGQTSATGAMSDDTDMKPSLYSLAEMAWKDAPPSIPAGAKIAVLEGDPSKEGPFVFRLKLADGYRIPPHTHPKVERITVIQGTFNVGMGEKFDETKTQPMPAGTYGYWPAGMKHFVWAKGETILQFHGMGPWTITYLNPADDPRNARK